VLVETAVLALCGGILGVLLAWWATGVLVSQAPPTIPRTSEIGIDARVLLFSFAVSVFAAILCGVLPAWEAARGGRGSSLKEGGRGGTSSLRQRRVFGTLVVAQFTLAVILLVAGGLSRRRSPTRLATSSTRRVSSESPMTMPHSTLHLGGKLHILKYDISEF